MRSTSSAPALGRARAELGDGGADVGIAEPGEALAGGAAGGDGGETPFHVAAVLLDVASHQGIDGGSVVGIEVAATDEVVGEGAGLVERPGLEGGDELDLVDQPVLECKQSEQQVAVGGDAAMGMLRAARPPPTRPATAPAPGRGGRRTSRIIAQDSVASISAEPVTIAPGGRNLVVRTDCHVVRRPTHRRAPQPGARNRQGAPQAGSCQTAKDDGGKPGVRFLARSKRGTRFRTASLLGGTRQRRRRFCSPWVGKRPRKETLSVALA